MIAGFKRKTLAWTITAIALTILVGCSTLTGAKTDILRQPGQSGGLQEQLNNEGHGSGEEQGNPAAENTEGPVPATENGEIGATPSESSGPAGQTDQDGITAVIIDPRLQNQDEKQKSISDKINAGQAVVYDEKGKVAGFAVFGTQNIRELNENGIINISETDKQKLQDKKDANVIYALIALTDSENKYLEQVVDKVVQYYIDKLKDKKYTGTYGDGFTWYTAAEELGRIGKPAVPYLIEKLGTSDDYERALALYALLLATQQENVKCFTGGEYINVNLDFDPANHPDMVKTATDWWGKYKNNF